uniref:Ovule protein n=1 Tax=Rhabditophanes sp. KR3021 TaxID=114890 RepID=A0AC35U4M9_9BILA
MGSGMSSSSHYYYEPRMFREKRSQSSSGSYSAEYTKEYWTTKKGDKMAKKNNYEKYDSPKSSYGVSKQFVGAFATTPPAVSTCNEYAKPPGTSNNFEKSAQSQYYTFS